MFRAALNDSASASQYAKDHDSGELMGNSQVDDTFEMYEDRSRLAKLQAALKQSPVVR